MEFFDSHFHIWDIPSGIHSAAMLGPEVGTSCSTYLTDAYEADVAAMRIYGEPLLSRGGVFIEAIAPDTYREAVWASESLQSRVGGRKYGVVAGIDFARPVSEVSAHLAKLRANVPSFVGCRQILNHTPSWPNVPYDYLNEATTTTWKDTFLSLIAKDRVVPSFDIQCNPHQLLSGVPLVFQHVPSDVPLILNHLGCYQEGQDISVWRQALAAFAQLPNAHVKLSMCWYVKNPTKAAEHVVEIVTLFGASRCMVGSNAPVDAIFGKASGGEPKGQFHVMGDVLEGGGKMWSPEDVKSLMFKTAETVYRV